MKKRPKAKPTASQLRNRLLTANEKYRNERNISQRAREEQGLLCVQLNEARAHIKTLQGMNEIMAKNIHLSKLLDLGIESVEQKLSSKTESTT